MNKGQLTNVIDEAEFLMEGLEKNLWRLIKIDSPEMWKYSGTECGPLWAVGILGNRCILVTGNNEFALGRFKAWGELSSIDKFHEDLCHLVGHIISSRFKL